MIDEIVKILGENKETNSKKIPTKKSIENLKKERVFGIGLSKTGTTSLADALRILGYETIDWMKEGKIIGWKEFFYTDAATDTPCCIFFESLYHIFPNSKFIYTTRDIKDWERSISEHFGVKRPFELEKRWKKESEKSKEWKWANTNFSTENALKWVFIHRSLYSNNKTWKKAYVNYDMRVKEFFENKNPDRYLQMSITGGDKWKKICQFLDKEPPKKDFPHSNKS